MTARAIGAACLLASTSAFCQTAPTAAPVAVAPIAATPVMVAPIVATPKPSGNMLPSNTEVWLSPNSEVNTKRIKQGDKFDMSVTRDIVLGDYIVIPRGTRGVGQVTMRTGKGAFGKSGKMEIDIVDLDLGGRIVPLTGHYRIEGQGNTGATVGAVVAVGVFAAFVTGHSASIAAGTEFRAFTSVALPITLAPAPVAAVVPATVTPVAAPAAAAPAVPAAPVVPAAPATVKPSGLQ